jgi:hypothetical protein
LVRTSNELRGNGGIEFVPLAKPAATRSFSTGAFHYDLLA